MRRLLLTLMLAAIAMTGCDGTSSDTPAACLEGSSFYLGKGQGDVRISDCLAKNQQAGDLATVGTAVLGAATRLNA
ncbi:MAG: hypothetical protein WA687_10165, partial [Solirubrobacterales bacterium]